MKIYLKVVTLFLLLSLGALPLSGCNSAQGDAVRFDPGIPKQVAGVRAESGNSVITLSWTGNPQATTYNIYYVCGLTSTRVTRANATVINTSTASLVIEGLDNNIDYLFMVTALNRDGESVDSVQVSAAPGPIGQADLTGVWYFHTLVTGPDARWEQGTLTVDAAGNAVISEFLDSSDKDQAPDGFVLEVDGSGKLSQSGAGAWGQFHGIMGSRKKLMTATWSPGLQSRAITIFQAKKDDSAPDYGIEDISGTGSGQNPNDPYLQGNGPTRFAYHQLYSGSNTEWEYANAKVGQHGNVWKDQYKDVIYWDFSTPSFKVVNYDYLWKVTSLGIDQTGLVSEYWNFENVVDPVAIPSFDTLVPTKANEVLFTGRMTADKTVVVGVATVTDADGGNARYFLRIIQLCFIPTDQALPQPGLNDLAGSYKFHKLSCTASSGGNPGAASWAYGTLSITGSGQTSFPSYTDSSGATRLSDSFALAYYADPNPDAKLYTDFANFTSAPQDGQPHYHDASGKALHSYYDFVSYGSLIGVPSTWRLEDISSKYYNEHASLSYNRDLLVLTRSDASGDSMLVGLK